MGMTRKYWKGLEELKETPEFLKSKEQEFPSQMSVEEFLSDENLKETSTARRDFLKFLGFSVAAATVAACEAPVTKVIPYVNKPEDVTPGMPTLYASTYYDGQSYASIIVKTREGRPIYIKGNKDFGITNGGTNAQIIASVLGLYDSARLQGPTYKGSETTWKQLDSAVMAGLKSAKKVTIVTNTIISPSFKAAVDQLALVIGATPENGKLNHIQYDAVSYAGMRLANKENFGADIIPSYDFSKAKTIVSVGADFLSSWLMPTAFATQYGKRRNPDVKSNGDFMSKHFQFESVMSVTGSNADYRGMIKPSEQANVLSYILKAFSVNTGISTTLSADAAKVADAAVKALKASKGESIVVAGSNNKSVQMLANKLNSVLENYGKTIDLNECINLFKSEDAKMSTFVKEVLGGKASDAVLFLGVNPVYTLANGKAFGEALKKVKLSVSFASHEDETAVNCSYIAPDHHALESWADYNPTTSHFAVAQPTIRPLFNTASALESVLVWAGKASRSGKDSKVAHEFIRTTWETSPALATAPGIADKTNFWSLTVHNSCLTVPQVAIVAPLVFKDAKIGAVPSASGLEVVLYQKAGIGIGAQANNPWLQELPDPMTKVTWDNYITMNPSEMEKGGYVTTYDQEHGLDLATVTVGGESVTLPVYPLPGQALGTVGIALGYGRGENGEAIGKAAFQTKEYGGHAASENGKLIPIGANVFRFVQNENGTMAYEVSGSIKKTEGTYSIAATQIHHTVMGRHSIVRETTLDTFLNKDKEAYNPAHMLQKLDKDGNHVERPVSEFDLWDAHPVEKIGHRWGMTIDLSSCIGCG
jgi:molybdopterin-containing oxidoreductase family iron-sulfur binding subunit